MQENKRFRGQDKMLVLRLPHTGEGEACVQEKGEKQMKDQAEQLIGQLQMYNQQLQGILMQKQALSMQAKEIEKALEEIDKAEDDIYRSIGPVLIKVRKENLKKDLAEEKEEAEIKLKAVEKQELRLKEKVEEIQRKFQEMPGEGG